jgi:hypothetical protein
MGVALGQMGISLRPLLHPTPFPHIIVPMSIVPECTYLDLLHGPHQTHCITTRASSHMNVSMLRAADSGGCLYNLLQNSLVTPTITGLPSVTLRSSLFTLCCCNK